MLTFDLTGIMVDADPWKVAPMVSYGYTLPVRNRLNLDFSWSPTQDRLLTILESAPLDNLADDTADLSGRKVEGEPVFCYHEEYEDDDPDLFPVFALRFKGTSQYAAYRYQILMEGEDNDIHFI